MIVPFSKRAYREGMRQTRVIRLMWLTMVAIPFLLYLVAFFDSLRPGYIFSETLEGDSSLLLFGTFFMGGLLLLIYPVSIFLSEWLTSSYHRNKRAAATMNALPVSLKERFFTSVCISGSNVLLITLYKFLLEQTYVVFACLYLKNRGSNPFKLYGRQYTDTWGKYLRSYVFFLLVGLFLAAFLVMCRELSHSVVMFIFWSVVGVSLLLFTVPVFNIFLYNSSNLIQINWVDYSGRDPFLSGVLELLVWTMEADAFHVGVILWLLVGTVLFLLVGWGVNRWYSVDYLENETANYRVAKLVYVVADLIAAALTLSFMSSAEEVPIISVICALAALPLVHFLIWNLLGRKRFLHTLRYAFIGLMAALILFVVAVLVRQEKLILPEKEDVVAISLQQGAAGSRISFYVSPDRTTVNRDAISLVYDRIKETLKGNQNGQKTADRIPYYGMLLTKKGTTAYRFYLRVEDLSRILEYTKNETSNVYEEEIDYGYFYSGFTKEEERTFYEILSGEEHRKMNRIRLDRRHAVTGVDVLLNGVGGSRIYPVPGLSDNRFLRLSEKQPKSIAYLMSIAEERFGSKVKECLTLYLDGDKNAMTAQTRLTIICRGATSEGINLDCSIQKKDTALYVWMDEEGTDYPVSEELTTAFFEMLFRNCDGKGTIEDSVMVYVKLDNEGNISEDMANRWYLMVTQSDILQWISQLREEYHEENIQ